MAARKDVAGDGALNGSPGSVPAMTSSMSAASATVRAIGPCVVSPPRGFELGALDTRPRDGLMPTTPQQLDGMRIDPPPSEPSAIGQKHAATAAADPPLDPPAVLLRSQGLWVPGNRPKLVVARLPNSGVLVLPSSTPPASRRRRATAASRSGTFRSRIREP